MRADLKILCDKLLLNARSDTLPDLDRQSAVTVLIADLVPVHLTDYTKADRRKVCDIVKKDLRKQGVNHNRELPQFENSLQKSMFYSALNDTVSRRYRRFVGEQLSTREIKYLLFMDSYRSRRKKDFYNTLADIIRR